MNWRFFYNLIIAALTLSGGVDLWFGPNAIAQERSIEWEDPSRGEQQGSYVQGRIEVPPGLRPAVDFWKLIFTKYGKNQVVFHHREYSSVIYSVLDFTSMNQELGASKAYEKRRREEVDAETDRIKGALLRLAESGTPSSPFERRIERMFKVLNPRDLRGSYRDAATFENIRSQTGIKERFREGLIRSRRYIYAIEEIFRELSLPRELSRLPLVESSFDYTAYSSVGAAGIWQFMRGTAKRYMRVDAYVDERRDPIVSTRAAAQYLSHAYNTLGAWPLAVTSYNHGISGVLRASREVGSTDLVALIRRYDGSGWGFASKNFYAEFLAAVEADRDARTYFPGIQFEAPWYFDEVKLGGAVSFQQLARAAGISNDRLEDLNRSLLKPVVSGRVKVPGGIVVKVPKGSGGRVVSIIPGSKVVHLTHIPVIQTTSSRKTIYKAPAKRSVAKKKTNKVKSSTQRSIRKAKTASPKKKSR